MRIKQVRPASPCQAATGLGFVKATTPDKFEHTALPAARQLPPAAQRLATRFRLPPSTALAVAEANAWGRQ